MPSSQTQGFDREFQDSVLSLLIQNRDFRQTTIESVEPSFFDDEKCQVIFSSLKTLFHSYPNISAMALKTYLSRTQNGRASSCVIKVDELASYDLDGDEAFIRDEMTRFVSHRTYRNAVYAALDKIETNTDLDAIPDLINHASQIASDGCGIRISRWFADREERLNIYATTRLEDNKVPTGLGCLDEALGGGLGKGELGIIIASTGVGKSLAMLNLAKNAVMRGNNVVYVSLEMQTDSVGMRTDAMLSGVPMKQLHGRARKIRNGINFAISQMTANKEVYTVYIPRRIATITNIRNSFHTCANEGFAPDMMIVDYADLVRPNVQYKEFRTTVAELYRDLRGIAQEFNIPLWTASQTNRGGEEKAVVTVADFAESYDKASVGDVIISLNQNVEEKLAGRINIFLAKVRNGESQRLYEFHVDYTTMLLSGGSQIPYTPGQKKGKKNQ